MCGALVGTGLSRVWPRDWAHRFFVATVWSTDEVGVALARLVVRLLIPAGAPVTMAVDDTLFHRRGRKRGPWAGSTMAPPTAPTRLVSGTTG